MTYWPPGTAQHSRDENRSEGSGRHLDATLSAPAPGTGTCAEPSPRGTARCLRPPHPDHPDAHWWEIAESAATDGWDEDLDSDKAHERRVAAREDWWELNHGSDGERP